MKTLITALAAAAALASPVLAQECAIELVVLGTSQDAGSPQMGHPEDPAWSDPSLRRLATALGVVDHETGARVLFEATPDMREQLYRLDQVLAPDSQPGLAGIFVTHAHIGHYAGLMFLGHESMGAQGVPLFAMERMADYLSTNGPWDQLVRYSNVDLQPMTHGEPVRVGRLSVTPVLVPHRQEYGEVVGYRIEGPSRSVFFLPDIDSWEEWDTWEEGPAARIEDIIASVDIAYLDATFYANGEIPGRDMSGFPHPFITHSMERFAGLPDEERAKTRFIHVNHTNPVRYPDAPERDVVAEAGYGLADEGERVCLSD
ncbi:MBL fold metallo-hydrolase [Maricaulis parjimensis]|uniref:MBL fold metallo-hydrolase n=1 Tax=Maricaulis parjimensis TaxID=144023 RepID=UPI00193A63C1|nr:MBL fold metallo-hydrolase [Maricaulis parjimensis]